METDPVVQLVDVVAVLDRFPALAGASLTVRRGEIVLLTGPNGAPYLPADVAWTVAGTNGVPEAIVGGIITLAVGLAVRGAGRARKSTV